MGYFAEFLGNHLCWPRLTNWNLIRKPSTLNTKRTIARQLQCNNIIDCSQNCLFFVKINILGGTIPASIYIFKVKNRSTRRRCIVSCKLTIKTPGKRQWIWTSKCLLRCYDMWRGFYVCIHKICWIDRALKIRSNEWSGSFLGPTIRDLWKFLWNQLCYFLDKINAQM